MQAIVVSVLALVAVCMAADMVCMTQQNTATYPFVTMPEWEECVSPIPAMNWESEVPVGVCDGVQTHVATIDTVQGTVTSVVREVSAAIGASLQTWAKPQGTGKCAIGDKVWSAEATAFPACNHLSSDVNCAVGPNGEDLNKIIAEYLCSFAADNNNMDTQSMCFDAVTRAVCALFDPTVVDEQGVIVENLQVTPSLEIDVLNVRYCNSLCDAFHDVCPMLPKSMCMQTGRCEIDADCTNIESSSYCVHDMDNSALSACIAMCPGYPIDGNPQCTKCESIYVAPAPSPVTTTTGPITTGGEMPVKGKGGVGAGTAFLVILLLVIGAFCVYCVAGIAYKRFALQASGSDQLPNATFWMGVFARCGLTAKPSQAPAGPAFGFSDDDSAGADVDVNTFDFYDTGADGDDDLLDLGGDFE